MSKAKTPAKTQTQTQTPTANGIIKGRPGKGRVLSLGQRKKCYAGHVMTPDNTFRYTAKRVKGKPKPVEREWCKRCRATSRKASALKRRLREAKEEKARQVEVKAQLTQALPKAKAVKSAKAAKASPAELAKANKGIKLAAEGKAKVADSRIGTTPKAKASGKATGKAKAKATGKARKGSRKVAA